MPLGEGQSRNIVLARRNFGEHAILPKVYDLLIPVILAEDKRNKITCWPSELPAAGEEVSMPSDAPSIADRRWYRDWLKSREEHAEAA